MEKEIENLIIKFLTKEANLDELRKLEVWINNPKNEILFFEYIKANALVNMVMSEYNENDAQETILYRIKKEKSIFYDKYNIIKYAVAAVFVGIFITTYIFRNNLFNSNTPLETTPIIANNNSIGPGTSKAILSLEDGSVVALKKGNTYKTQNLNSNGEQIIYQPLEQNSAKTEYNYLTIERGGQFFLKLSDGTQVWLNSESKLKYPISFKEGEMRQVELVYGEAYFDVSPSIDHKGAKFKVITNTQELEVLGTEFNIKAYKDESNIYTTLVEGLVEINTSVEKKILTPNQQSNVDVVNNNMSVAVVDVYSEISWKNGIFSFKGKSLKDIMNVISRWYDVDVIFVNKDLESIKFKGILSKNQNIEEILSIMKSNTINNYEIIDKTIILK
ncbi:FecR family protein [Mariniflexile rhizosphaerae]|uniref:FecR family protein n=1 Tax=unclassified Mariniflexile TaxID=2643887 RepID=UPI0013C359E2|nr:FecR family protein [Mariniflexile sp. TRM1-10]